MSTQMAKPTIKSFIFAGVGVVFFAARMQAAVLPPSPTIVSLPARPSVVQIQAIASQALVAAAQAGGTLAQVQNAAAQRVLLAINAPNAVNPTGGSATLAQALSIVTSNPVAAQAQFAQVTPQASALLAQNAASALQLSLAQQAASLAATKAAALANPLPPAPAGSPIQPPAFVPPVTVVSLPARITPVQLKSIATSAIANALQTGGTFAQVQNAAAQTVLSALNAPNAVNPAGGGATLAQALSAVNNAAAQVSVAGGLVVPVTLPPQAGHPGAVTINQVIPFTPQQKAILNQLTAGAALQPVAIQPPVTPPTAVIAPVQPVVSPTPLPPVAIQPPPAPAPIATRPAKVRKNVRAVQQKPASGGKGYAVPGEVVPAQPVSGKGKDAQAEKQLNAKEKDEKQSEAMDKDNQESQKDMDSRGRDMDKEMDRDSRAGRGPDGLQEDRRGKDDARQPDQGGGTNGDNGGSTGGGSDGGSRGGTHGGNRGGR